MPSTDRRLELKAKDIDGSDRLTAGCVCQWVKQGLTHITVNKKEHHNSRYSKAAFGTPCILIASTDTAFYYYELFMGNFVVS